VQSTGRATFSRIPASCRQQWLVAVRFSSLNCLRHVIHTSAFPQSVMDPLYCEHL
jgi:hypothetical protein